LKGIEQIEQDGMNISGQIEKKSKQRERYAPICAEYGFWVRGSNRDRRREQR